MYDQDISKLVVPGRFGDTKYEKFSPNAPTIYVSYPLSRIREEK